MMLLLHSMGGSEQRSKQPRAKHTQTETERERERVRESGRD